MTNPRSADLGRADGTHSDPAHSDPAHSDPKREEELHQLLDGELSESEFMRVEAALNEKDAADLTDFERLGEMLRAHADDVSADLRADDIFSKIQTRVDEDHKLGRGYMRVVVGGGKRKAVAGLGLALAAAAALGIFARSKQPAPIARGTADAGATVAVLEEPVLGSEVVEVDFGGNAGTVFAVEGSAGQPLAVVWIEDEKPSL